ncbi:MAG TPA: DUF47 family protein [Labilithrix sp.]|jgi:predicted phosphate transport protein (TIGR00153 family)|nr:DUF47 family protein [Labilithrix sp.]
MFGSGRKDAAFFSAFVNHAKNSVDAAQMLAELIAGIPATADPTMENAKRIASRIKEIESAGDRITHETIKSLRENWITPLDRADIHDLITRMDDVLDFIEEAASRVIMFEVTAASPEASELASIVVRSCEAMLKAVGLLNDMKKAPEILELCVEVNRLENAADAVHRKAIADLFRSGNDPLTVMKWRDIFDSLESATDSCEDVANVVEGVVLEYA